MEKVGYVGFKSSQGKDMALCGEKQRDLNTYNKM